MIINLKCSECKSVYNFEVGKITLNEKTYIFEWEFKSVCPKCGAKDKDLLTELGQGQVTEWNLRNM